MPLDDACVLPFFQFFTNLPQQRGWPILVMAGPAQVDRTHQQLKVERPSLFSTIGTNGGSCNSRTFICRSVAEISGAPQSIDGRNEKMTQHDPVG